MTLYARYKFPNNGHESDKKSCKQYLIEGKRYEVITVTMGQSSTYITLLHMPCVFNSVNFEFENEDGSLHDIYKDPNYNPYIKRKEEV